MVIKLIVFDVDGVLLDVRSTWRYFHKKLGTHDLEWLERLRDSHFSGRLSYQKWADEETSAWKEIPYEKFISIYKKIPFIENVTKTTKELKKRGYKLAAVSVGILLKGLKKRLEGLDFDYIYANDLEEKNGVLTGKSIVTINHFGKIKVINEIASCEKIKLGEIAAVGDDLNDRGLFRKVGFSIAFCPSDPKLIKYAKVVVDKKDLSEILPYFSTIKI